MNSIAYKAPTNWQSRPKRLFSRSRLSSDFCKIVARDGSIERSIRCILEIPIQGLEDNFMFGVWASVSKASWKIYKAGFRKGIYKAEGCSGYLLHDLPEFPNSYALPLDIVFGQGNDRPNLELHETDHPLFIAQSEGISLRTVEAIAAQLAAH